MYRRTAPAKLNLTLDILGRRDDGYHDMRMVMQTVSLRDTVTLEEQARDFTLTTAEMFLPTGKKSLEERAAEAFFSAVGMTMPGLRVTLDKAIPAYAGVGGGSADVAALLRLLREAYAPDLPTEALERIGLEVGSDMPFCVRGGTVLAEGRGERMTDLTPLPDCWFVLCKPGFGIPTPMLFAMVDQTEICCRPDTAGMVAALRRGDLEGVAARLYNVFEEVLPEEYGEVFTIKSRLMELGALNAAMSGSGPTVFGLFLRENEARAASEILRRTYRETFLVRPVGKIDDSVEVPAAAAV